MQLNRSFNVLDRMSPYNGVASIASIPQGFSVSAFAKQQNQSLIGMVNLAAKIQMADMVASPEEQEQPSGESVAKPAFHWSGFFCFSTLEKVGPERRTPFRAGCIWRRISTRPCKPSIARFRSPERRERKERQVRQGKKNGRPSFTDISVPDSFGTR